MGVGLLLVRDLDRHPGWTVGLLAAGFLWQTAAVRRLAPGASKSGLAGAGPAGAILLVAILMRLPLVALPPTLSDDVLRYAWDGRVAAARENPYALAPEAAELAALRDPLWDALPHRDVPTVYPPLAVGLFSIAARTPHPVAAIKALAGLADVAAIVLLVALARRRSLPESRVAWYAWSPLAALETAGMGHVDALGAAAAVGAVLALTPRPDGRRTAGAERAPRPQPVAAAIAAAAGALAKLVPLAALPMWARQSRRPALFVLLAAGTVGVALLPVVAATGGVPPGLVTYGVDWEFNGPLYEPLWRALDLAGADDAVHRALDGAKEIPRLTDRPGWHAAVNRFYPHAHPRFLAKLLLVLLAGWLIVSSLRRDDPVAGSRDLFGGLLLASATVYPWYALWFLPFAALTRSVPWLALAALLPLCYLPQLGSVALFPWIWALIWLPFGALWLHPRWRARSQRGQSAP